MLTSSSIDQPSASPVLLPATSVGHLRDEELLELIDENPGNRPRGELRFFSSLYGRVSVIIIHQGNPRWIPLLPLQQRQAFLQSLRLHPSPGSIRSWGRLLQRVGRSALRWYPYAFQEAAFSSNEPVVCCFGKYTREGKIKGIDLIPNGYPETMYELRLAATGISIYAFEHQVFRPTDPVRGKDCST